WGVWCWVFFFVVCFFFFCCVWCCWFGWCGLWGGGVGGGGGLGGRGRGGGVGALGWPAAPPENYTAVHTLPHHAALPIWITDDRVKAFQVLAVGGRAVKAAAEAALRTGSPEAVRKFLAEGQHTARA
ncbi:hypothetical protein PUR61_16695, partial [Streptomyces sp. BE20]|nr:hypothetical protein [Streptomyces sp. BE20]